MNIYKNPAFCDDSDHIYCRPCGVPIPGPQGPRGPAGPSGSRGSRGPRGLPGSPATITIGETTIGAPGTPAQVINTGSRQNAVLQFVIPSIPAPASIAQYQIDANSNSPLLRLTSTLQKGVGIAGSVTEEAVTLAAGWAYQISYNIVSSLPSGSSMHVVPLINQTPEPLYSSSADASTAPTVSCACSFLLTANGNTVLSLSASPALPALYGQLSIVSIIQL